MKIDDEVWIVPFLELKLGVDMSSRQGQQSALEWLKTAGPDDMYYSDPPEDRDKATLDMELTVGMMRKRSMMEYVEGLLRN